MIIDVNRETANGKRESNKCPVPDFSGNSLILSAHSIVICCDNFSRIGD